MTVLFVAAAAWGQTTITVCATDTQLAAALAGGGTINFACGGPAVIRVTRAYSIARSTVVDGGGTVTLDRGGGYGMFAGASEAVRLELKGLTLRNGQLPPRGRLGTIGGSLISGKATFFLTGMRIENSQDPVWTSGGVMNITDSSFTGNTGTAVSAQRIYVQHTAFENPRADPIELTGSLGTQSFLSISRQSSFTGGGPVRAIHGVGGGCRVEISSTTFARNHGTPYPGNRGNLGGALWSNCDTAIDHTSFTGNQAVSGGAIFLTQDAKADLRRVQFIQNSASGAGGAIALEPTVAPRTLRLRYCTFTGNTAQDGGAIDLGSAIENAVTFDAAVVLFSSNSAQRTGGAIHGENASASIVQGIFNGNSAEQRGGAIAIDSFAPHQVGIANSLLVGNRAAVASALSAAGASLVNVTLANNNGPLFRVFPPAPPALWKGIRVQNTILWAPAGGACAGQAIQDRGNNLQWPKADCGAAIPVADPKLDSLFVPLAGSAALNHGNDAACAAAPVNSLDVFGQRRPQNASCTIGAVEYHIEHLPYLEHRPPQRHPDTGTQEATGNQ